MSFSKMDFRWFLVAVVVVVCVERSCSLPLVCSYNGTSYREGDPVRTEEPCLSCTCQRGALECSLRVCPEYPDILPPGCFLIHKPKDCCPQLFCEETFNPIGVELRTGFKLENKLHGNDCIINGSIYAEGSAVASSQVCEYCYCVEGEMKCIKPRCLQTFHGCKPIYEKSSCCPTHYDCRDADVDFLAAQVKTLGSTNSSTVASDSLRSLSNLEIEPENENTETESTEAKVESTEKLDITTTTETSTEVVVSTIEPEESTTAVTEHLTTLGFQTTKTENPNKETTTIQFTEETTLGETTTDVPRSESQDVQIRSKLTLFDGTENPVVATADNSSQEVEDYDSYDYSEPQLPPSLPNLVIFPFVAADAVVKEENVAPAEEYDKVEIDRFDTHPVFYKDYFSPPVKTEGGFVPKEPPKPDEPFYEYNFFGKEQIEPPSMSETTGGSLQTAPSSLNSNEKCMSNGREIRHQEILPSTRDCVTCTCLHGKIVCQDLGCSTPQQETNTSSSVQEPPITPSTNPKPTPDPYGVSDTQPKSKNDSTAFPDSLITKKPVTVTYKNFVLDFYPNYLITTTRGEFKIQPLENSLHEGGYYQATPFGLLEESTSPISEEETTIKMSTTSESSFFDDFLKSFLSDDTTTTTMTTTTKRKYSSKIKGHVTTTIKPEVSKTPLESDNDDSGRFEETESTKTNTGALLKLAGCNIYGMMYRVGKVITELSGPCLECLCTDLGVQCRPLKC